MKSTSFLVAFLLGFFICLSMYILYPLISSNKCTNIEAFNEQTETPAAEAPAGQATTPTEVSIPRQEDKFMLLTTFNNAEKISQASFKWYEHDKNIVDVTPADINNSTYFTFSNYLNIEQDSVLSNGVAANLLNVQLSGPLAMNFANEVLSYSLTEMTVIFMIKLKEIVGHSTLFEMVGNTKVYENNDVPVYVAHVVSIDFTRKTDKLIDITIMFGEKNLIIPDISVDTLVNDNFLLLAMTYDGSVIQLIIDNRTYKFTLNDKQSIVLGSMPVIINKAGELNVLLYTMAYYKKTLSLEDILSFKKFFNYNITGIQQIIDMNSQYMQELQQKEQKCQNNQDKLKDITNKLDKCMIYNEEEDDSDLINKYIIPKLAVPYPRPNARPHSNASNWFKGLLDK